MESLLFVEKHCNGLRSIKRILFFLKVIGFRYLKIIFFIQILIFYHLMRLTQINKLIDY